MDEKTTSQQWEIQVMEEMAASDEMQLLDLSQDIAIRLIGDLADIKADIQNGGEIFPMEIEMLRMRIGRMAVMLDVLQLRYGDAANEEQQFLEAIEESLKEE